jgi:hypothetical protein
MHMRQGGLHLTFAGLNGGRAITRAWHDNTASLRVKRSLPYTDDGPVQQQRRDRPDTMSTFSITHRNGRPSAITTSISPASGRHLAGIGPIREFSASRPDRSVPALFLHRMLRPNPARQARAPVHYPGSIVSAHPTPR